MITVQAIYYTHRTAEWHRFASSLGLAAAFDPEPEWSEFDGDGILAIHRVDADSDRHGSTDLHVLVDDLDDVESALRHAAVEVSREELEGVGPVVTARTASGATLTASTGARLTHGDLRVQPIWSQEDRQSAINAFRAVGLKERIRSDSGTWVDFQADAGGLAAFHAGTTPITLSFEYIGDLDRLAARLTDAGYETSIVDEAYNRTLLVRTPDDWMLWINGQMTDLYGYHVAG